MFYIDADQNRYYLRRQFSYLGTNYGASAATHEKFLELGFTQVTVGPRPDDRFYIVSGPDNTGAYNATPRDLGKLKLRFIMEQKRLARSLMTFSDWYVIRSVETGAPMPVEFENYRTQVRNASNSRCEEIAMAADIEELKELITSPEAMTPFPAQVEEEELVAESYDLPYDAPQAPDSAY